MLRTIVSILCSTIILWGCQTPPDIKALQDKNGVLQQQLSESKTAISTLEVDKQRLEKNVTELERVKGVLGEEKSSRVVASTHLRGEIRQFVQVQIDNLKQFLLASDLLDYVGGELVQRSSIDDESVLVLDMHNPVPRNGSLTGVSAYFQNAGAVSVRVLRPIENNFVVVWASALVKVNGVGKQRLEFPVSVGVTKGDVLAYYFSEPRMVSFDTGTGDTRYKNSDIDVGEILKPSSMNGSRDKRAYSIGVIGLLNVE
jgi:hypothetical protein